MCLIKVSDFAGAAIAEELDGGGTFGEGREHLGKHVQPVHRLFQIRTVQQLIHAFADESLDAFGERRLPPIRRAQLCSPSQSGSHTMSRWTIPVAQVQL
jgi:hypothetical protein